ncbi:hypothetical protein LPJ73_002871 [Coemansia sp. RSA 2703]|nr:hypothetical protein LPJ73_002871 [Coemansia sp. RSA 2703]
MLQASDWRPSTVSTKSKVDMVTRVCKDEYISAGYIDWTKVSKLTGLNQLECMEVCDMEDYKRQWIYDPKTFSWDDANRMTDFIAANYPETLPVNYRAVSNYMWVKIGDCIDMHSMLQGKFRWTDDIKDRVVQMRSQGHTFRYIANQLSPHLSASTVNRAYFRHTHVHTPISDEEKQRITELVDKYVGKVPVKEVIQKVKSESASWNGPLRRLSSF